MNVWNLKLGIATEESEELNKCIDIGYYVLSLGFANSGYYFEY